MTLHSNGEGGGTDRVAIVAGLRTPFCKAHSSLKTLRTVDLAVSVVKELLARTVLDPREVTLCVYGHVVPTLDWVNLAREVVLGTPMRRDTDAFSVSRACATSLQAATSAAGAILLGQHEVAIAGGADSTSDVPLGLPRRLRDAVLQAHKGSTLADKLRGFTDLSMKDLTLPPPGFLREPTTGETMGEGAEKMAQENGISRREQDEVAHRSHRNAARAWDEGFYADQVVHLYPPPYAEAVTRDNLVRAESSLETLAKLPPAFDKKHGSVTAGNASPLTDGASALLLMREAKAKALGFTPLGYFRSWAYAAVDPGWQLLMGPAFAIPKALARAKVSLSDIEVFEMHEAFAAQLVSNLKALASKQFATERLGRSEAVGEVDPDRLNVNGGSIALGHPFGATGARVILSALAEMRRRKAGLGLVSVCAAGGLGGAAVLEAV